MEEKDSHCCTYRTAAVGIEVVAAGTGPAADIGPAAASPRPAVLPDNTRPPPHHAEVDYTPSLSLFPQNPIQPNTIRSRRVLQVSLLQSILPERLP